ncbi:BCCT family transporter [Halomonas sp. 86]|uniref:BCCT family transporter n=1 Tax=Halomonas sp. 86 TaxID=3457737 RepID=UPI0040344C80
MTEGAIREFVLGVLFAPSIFTLVWFAIFGWSAMEIDGIGSAAREAMGDQAGVLSAAVAESIPLAMFAFFDNFPAATLIQGLAVVIVAIFFATSSDSASLVVDMLCTGSPDPGPWHQRVFWGVSEGMLAAMLIVLAGDAGLTALQEVITVVGLPMFILVFVMMFSLLRGLSHEDLSEVRVGSPPNPEKLNE